MSRLGLRWIDSRRLHRLPASVGARGKFPEEGRADDNYTFGVRTGGAIRRLHIIADRRDVVRIAAFVTFMQRYFGMLRLLIPDSGRIIGLWVISAHVKLTQ